MQACTQWTHSNLWSQLAPTQECSFKIRGRQSKKKSRNGDRRVIGNATCRTHPGRRVLCLGGVSDGFDGACPLWSSYSALTEMYFGDVISCSSHQSLLVEFISTLQHWRVLLLSEPSLYKSVLLAILDLVERRWIRHRSTPSPRCRLVLCVPFA